MLKKFGMVTVGVTAGLLAVAPLASASEGHHEHGHDKGHHKSHGHHDGGSQRGTGNIQCGAEGGDFQANGAGDVIGAVLGPIGSGNTGQLASCNSFLNDNLNNASINVLSEQVI